MHYNKIFIIKTLINKGDSNMLNKIIPSLKNAFHSGENKPVKPRKDKAFQKEIRFEVDPAEIKDVTPQFLEHFISRKDEKLLHAILKEPVFPDVEQELKGLSQDQINKILTGILNEE